MKRFLDLSGGDRRVPLIEEDGRITTGFNGTWTGDAWLVGLDVGYNF